MADRVTSQERLRFISGSRTAGALERLDTLLGWSSIAERLDRFHASAKGKAA